jgi:phosphoglycerol transferase
MANRYRNLMGFIVVAVLLLSGCGDKTPTYTAEINFAEDPYPDFVAEVKGLSAKEDWGRWSDADIAPTVVIRFKEPLPKKFTLTLKAQVNLDNESPKLKIGKFEQELFIQQIGESVSVPVELTEPADTIEIIPTKPMTPKELGINDDARRLGVGLFSLRIEA